MPRQLGDAFVTVSPDGTGFREKAYAQIKKALAGIKPTVPVELRMDRNALGQFMTAAEKSVIIKANLDAKDFYAKVVDLKSRLESLHEFLGNIPIGVDDKDAQAKMAALQARLLALAHTVADIKVGADTSGLLKANAAVLALEASTDRLARASAKSVAAFMLQAEAETEIIRKSAEAASVQGALAAAFASTGGKATVAAGGMSLLVGAMDRLDAASGNTVTSVNGARIATGLLAATWGNWGGIAGALTGKIRLFGGIFDRFLPTWARSVAVWHLAADVAVELIAVWGGAAVAATAFGIAGSDAALEVFNRMNNLHIAADSTRLSMYPLTGAMESLHDAVRPQVYQIFGDALEIMGKRSGDFARLATGAAAVTDRLAARITNAIISGKDFKKFTDDAVKSLDGLGTAFGNVFGAIGNVIHVIPGYAQILLGLGVALTGILENVTRMLEPVLKWGLILHGAFLYIGLAVTATLALGRTLIPLITGFVNAAAGAAFYAVSLADVAANEGLATAAGIALSRVPIIAWAAIAAAVITGLVLVFRHGSDATKDFTNNLLKQADAVPVVQALTANLQAQANIVPRLAAANQALSQANAQYTRLGKLATDVNKAFGSNSGIRGQSQQAKQLATAYTDASAKVTTFTAAQKELQVQYTTLQSRLQPLVKQTGSMSAALGVLNAAGITTAQLAMDQGTAWDIDNVQIQGTIDSYRAMTGVAGQLNNDLDVLGRTLTDQYTATQKLNDAWSTFITDVTSTQGSFDTVAQGFEVLASHSGDLKLSLGKLKATFSDTAGTVALQGRLATATAAVASAQGSLAKLQKSGTATSLQLRAAQDRLLGAQDRLTVAQLNLSKAQSGGIAAIDALTPAGIALNQAFTDQIGNIDKLLASWRTAGLANNLFVQGVKDSIAPLVKYANGSQEATAQLIALAQEAGYHGPISMKELVKWLGNTKNATKDLKGITNQATVQEALLTGAMQAQGNFIANTLIGDINNAILKYGGVRKAATDYGTAIAQFGKTSEQAKAKQDALISSIVKAGVAAGDTTGQIGAMIAKILGIPLSKAIDIVLQMQGKGNIVITGTGINQRTINTTTGVLRGPGGHTIAKGAYIAHGKGPTIDDFPALLARGEVVVPANMVSAGLVDHLRGRIPGFAVQRVRPDHRLNPMRYAAGGLAGFAGGQIDKGVSGMSNAEALFGQGAAVALAQAAIKAAQAVAASGFLGPGSGNYAADIQAVLKAMGLPLSLTANWLSQIQTESGGNLRAVNLTDSNAQAGHPSVGLLQLIPGTFAAYAGPYRNTPPLVNFGGGQVSEDPMAQIYAAIHYAAARYGGAGMAGVIGHGHGYKMGGLVGSTYDKGGILPPWKIGVNTSGKAEMVTPATGGGSLHETNMLLRQMIHAVQENTRVTGAQGQQFAHGIGVATARGAGRGYYGG